jgi:hypothetical protein
MILLVFSFSSSFQTTRAMWHHDQYLGAKKVADRMDMFFGFLTWWISYYFMILYDV